jgi:hypothetical protein
MLKRRTVRVDVRKFGIVYRLAFARRLLLSHADERAALGQLVHRLEDSSGVVLGRHLHAEPRFHHRNIGLDPMVAANVASCCP